MDLQELIPENIYLKMLEIINDAEGLLPVVDLKEFILENSLTSREIAYTLAKLLLLKGFDISKADTFFEIYPNNKINPGLYFWRAYDALLRGNIVTFRQLWGNYIIIELKHYEEYFIKESIVIPEDPIFINVKNIVHDHQQRLLNYFILSEEEKKTVTDITLDQKLEVFLGKFSSLLAFFRIQHIQFRRNITIDDLKNLDILIKDSTIDSLGSYWEIRFLTLLSYWRIELGVIYEAIESISQLKLLNSVSLNNLVESQIFHLESIISIKNNNKENFFELLQSAEYLASEYNYIYQYAEILISRAKYDQDNFLEVISKVEAITNESDHKFVRAKIYSLLGSYFINRKDWKNAEIELMKASKFLHEKFDLKLYYQVVSDFSYVLIISNQIKQSLEGSAVLLEDDVPMLYRLRGFYLYGVGSLLSNDLNVAISSLEEGIRVALNHKEELSLPWFYEFLGIIHITTNTYDVALRYFELTFKAYYDISYTKEGYRAKIITCYLLALNNQFGMAFTQIQSLLANEISDLQILTEILWGLQSIILLSEEKIEDENFIKIWNNQIKPSNDNDILLDLYYSKHEWIKSINKGSKENLLVLDPSEDFILRNSMNLELMIWDIILSINENNYASIKDSIFNFIISQLDHIKLDFNLINTIKTILADNDFETVVKNKKTMIKVSFVLAIIRLAKFNLPFPEFLS